jgi:16S rRNA A1518/A1519 N6-dimethyltransferase RsmA/KsgA/DIM1 with predicted DNA glycosylase/AP lyase activity
VTLPLFEKERPEHNREASQWFTPAWLAKRLVDWCGSPTVNRVLEPSAGGGALVDAVRERWFYCQVTAYETDPRWAAHLRQNLDRLELNESDFLASRKPHEPYDLCVMNAPYEGGQDLAFLRHAMRCSNRIVAIVRLGFVANQGTRRAVREQEWSWISVASLGRVRFDGDGDTSPLSDFAAIKLSRYATGRPCELEWWER